MTGFISFNRGRAALVLAALAASSPAVAQQAATRAETIRLQRAEKAKTLEPEQPSKLEKRLLDFEDKKIFERWGQAVEGVFPVLGGLASGQGLALGVQYVNRGLAGGELQFRSSARGSIKKSYLIDMQLTAPKLAGDKLEFDSLVRHRNLSEVDYYGQGPDSSIDDRTTFRLEDTSIDGTARYRPFGRYLILGGRAGLLQVNTGRGGDAKFPSVEDLFVPLLVPGLADQTDFVRTGGFVKYDYRDSPRGPRSGGLYSFEFTNYEDFDLGRHDFRQVDIEAQQYIPFFNKKRVIVLRGRTVMNFKRDGQSVPFYLQPYLGGPRELRGFDNYRFYDDNALVLNAEYRWEAFSGLDAALFVDAGKVTPTRADLDLSDLESAVGFGLRFNIRNATFLRLDVAFSHEATQIWFRFGNPF